MNYFIRNVESFFEIGQNNIPKKIHVIWKSDGSEYPKYLEKQLKDWSLVLDQSWEIVFWNNYSLNKLKNESDDFGRILFDIAEKQKEIAAYVDIIRYYILWKFGGYYFDADFEVHRSIDPLSHINSDFIICNSTDAYYPYVDNSFFAVAKGYSFLKYCLDNIVDKFKNPDYYNEWIVRRTGPIFLGAMLIQYDGFTDSVAKIYHKYFYRNEMGDFEILLNENNEEYKVPVFEKFEQRFARHMFIETHALNNPEPKKPDYDQLFDKNVPLTYTKDIEDAYIYAHMYDIGDFTYGRPHVTWYEGYKGHLRIGKFCSIAPEVEIFVNGYHNTGCVSTYPFCMLAIRKMDGFDDADFSDDNIPYNKDIVIGNDVYIGERAVIMGNVVIGDGAVIAANSVVTKNVEPYEIVGGNPARHISYRFSKEQIEKLLEIRWWDWDVEKIRKNVRYITSKNINEFINRFYYEQN